MNLFTLLFVAVVLAQIMVEWWLSQRHITHIQTHRQAVPEAFSKTIPLSAHQQAADYTVICTRFRQYELLFGTLLLFLWTLGGGLDLLDTFWRGLELPPLGAGTAFMLSVFIVMALLDIPLSAYPTFIAPLFNKFDPLRDESLRHRIEALLGRNGFSNKGIFVMDGSLRSTHGNAYFTGFGAAKRIVFFDTLLAGFDAEEIESVLAHELGHFKRKHILKQMVLMAGLSFVGFAVLGWLIDRLWFYQGLGISTPSTHVALILFLMVAPVFSFLLQPVLAAISRKYEFEADEFAAEQADGRSLIRALVKLYKDNASTLTPDPWYSAFHDSHPPAPLRVAHLAAKGGTR